MNDRMNELLAKGLHSRIDRFVFEQKHPYVLSDGRRFCSLELAAQTAYQMRNWAMVTHEPTGRAYDWEDCARIATRDRRAACA